MNRIGLLTNRCLIGIGILVQVLLLLVLQQREIVLVNGFTVAVFGGSGYIGRRISRTLIDQGCDVISISRSGKPPSYYINDCTGIDNNNKKKEAWSDQVTWIRHDIDPNKNMNRNRQIDEETQDFYKLPKIDAAISCIGNVNPDQEWLKSSFFGLAFNNERLYYENGILNEYAIQMAKDAGAKRCVYISVSYETAKMLEGPIAGYIDGKRKAEHTAYTLFGKEDENAAIVLGPSLIYGGKRPGALYRSFVESIFAKMYVNGNESLRNLSSTPLEDWVEKVLFSPPVKVDVVARVASAAAIGFVNRDIVGARRQGFFDTNGKPIIYDDIVSVDGTTELERVDEIIKPKLVQWKEEQERKTELFDSSENSSVGIKATKNFEDNMKQETHDDNNDDDRKEPPFEGALIGKKPFLFPIPVAGVFVSIFYLISSGQFIKVNN
mmetsp:Transcript_9197/g.11590  ORF Transcript_9197/g.11590 Transcript_9197/m.11590 type:complete len:437 (-) Transcript_9197:76-1386(-)